MSSLVWRIQRLRAMRPREVAFRVRQALRIRKELTREPSKLALLASTWTPTFRPTKSRVVQFFDYSFPYPDILPDWHTDKQTGITAPDLPWPKIDYRKADEVGLAKNIWELNRHQFLEEWAQEKTEDAAIAIGAIILDWIAENPQPIGINWASSLESAFRMMSWQRALETVGGSEQLDKVMPIIQQSAMQQCDHILRFPSLFSSANNHRIGELTGALAGACILGGVDWARSVFADFKHEIQMQVTADGVDREQAIFYHIYVLGFLHRTKHYAQILGLSDDPFFEEHIAAMSEFANAMAYAVGQWFEIGDRDDGVLPLDTLPTPKPFVGLKMWQQAGYAIYHDARLSACFRAGPFGYPSIAAHAHCDQLSVLLVADGYELLADSGTFCYHEDDEMRRYFKGTSAHNTVRVDGIDQAEYGGPFLWSTHSNGKLEQVSDTEAKGSHDGYLRLGGEVWHRRAVAFANESLLVVGDIVDAKGTHDFELFWNLGPGIRVTTDGEKRLIITNPEGRRYVLTIDSDLSCRIEITKGWHSRSFGKKQAIEKVVVSASGTGWRVTSTLRDEV